jgi:hypothetical protein
MTRKQHCAKETYTTFRRVPSVAKTEWISVWENRSLLTNALWKQAFALENRERDALAGALPLSCWGLMTVHKPDDVSTDCGNDP